MNTNMFSGLESELKKIADICRLVAEVCGHYDCRKSIYEGCTIVDDIVNYGQDGFEHIVLPKKRVQVEAVIFGMLTCLQHIEQLQATMSESNMMMTACLEKIKNYYFKFFRKDFMKITVEGKEYRFELTGHFADIWPEMFKLLLESETVSHEEDATDWSEPLIESLAESPDEVLYELGWKLRDFKASLKDTGESISDATLSDFLAFFGYKR